MRARPNDDDDVRFNHKSQLSFKPQQYNKTYQRASTPDNTMFYGCVLPEKIGDGELDNERLISMFEASSWLRDKDSSGYQKLTFSRWEVQEDITLTAIMHNESYYDASIYTKELVDAYSKFIKAYPKDFADRSLTVQDFLANQFSKEIDSHTDYKISAIFTDSIIYKMKDKQIDGVIYPSVRVDGKGFNVAIKPEACSKLGLFVAGECSIYKLKNEILVDNDYLIELDGKQDDFELKELINHRQAFLSHFGFHSIDELKKLM